MGVEDPTALSQAGAEGQGPLPAGALAEGQARDLSPRDAGHVGLREGRDPEANSPRGVGAQGVVLRAPDPALAVQGVHEGAGQGSAGLVDDLELDLDARGEPDRDLFVEVSRVAEDEALLRRREAAPWIPSDHVDRLDPARQVLGDPVLAERELALGAGPDRGLGADALLVGVTQLEDHPGEGLALWVHDLPAVGVLSEGWGRAEEGR